MAITIGTHLGSVQITALLGRGGMGEVYRARDTKLKRDVAIKILPEEFSRDPDRVGRFQREAEVLALLNHPHIASVLQPVPARESVSHSLPRDCRWRQYEDGSAMPELRLRAGSGPPDPDHARIPPAGF